MTKQWRLITHDSLNEQINGAILPSFSTLSCYSCILYHSGLNLPAFPTTHSSQFGIKEMLVEANGQNDQIMMTLTKNETKYRFLLCSSFFLCVPYHPPKLGLCMLQYIKQSDQKGLECGLQSLLVISSFWVELINCSKPKNLRVFCSSRFWHYRSRKYPFLPHRRR